MSDPLAPLKQTRKSGDEPFRAGGRALDFNLRSFWQWVASDLVTNTARGLVAEYLVARALGLTADGIRVEWSAFDVLSLTGVSVEVKSAAYIQSWHQKKPSSIQFRVPKTRGWDAATNTYDAVTKRQAQVYVFALLAHTDKLTIDPLDVDQWQFFVLPTHVLDARTRSQHSITLPSLKRLCSPATYENLAQAVEAAKSSCSSAGDRPARVRRLGIGPTARGV